jgi:hypothetical protein
MEKAMTNPPIRGVGTAWILRSPGKSTAPIWKAARRIAGLSAQERAKAIKNNKK